jgi:DNA-binding SARP family transcriptional activator/tetratricopeptide (TPR) repeat protein
VKFGVLGPLTASVILPSAGQPRRLLAVLLAKPNEFVHRDALVDELWPEGAPSSAAAIVQVTVSKLRKVLSPGLDPGGDEQRLRSGPLGYRLTVGEGELDADQFLLQAAVAATTADPVQRRELLEGALSRWRGPAFEDVSGGPLVEAHKVWLDDRRWSVFRTLVDLELADGLHRRVVDRLELVVAERPTDEQLVARLATALERCGQRDAAIEALRRAQQALWERAGVRPGRELVALYRRIAGREWTTGGPPAQLPSSTPDFFGRTRLVGELTTLRGPAPILLHGPAGVGKTALAVHAAKRARKRFPDGQLVAELRRPDGTPVEPREVLARFLVALGVVREDLPGDPDELAALWRGHTHGRRLLVLLDDAVSERQVRSLLPAGSKCAALVTSRRRLLGLAGARPVEVGELDDREAFDLFESIAGCERLLADPDAAARVVSHCRGLPLAIRVAGAKLAQRPHLLVAELAARLDVERRRLDELTAGDVGVRQAVASSLRDCSPPEREALRLLGALELPEVTEWSAAALLDVPVQAARDLLDALADGHLVRVTGRDQLDFARYTLYEFVRLLVREHPRTEADSGAVRRAMVAYLGVAEYVVSLLDRGSGRAPDDDLVPVEPALLERVRADPIAWRDAEVDNVAAAVRIAGDNRWYRLTERLSDAYAALADVQLTGPSAHVVSVLGLAAARSRRGQPVAAFKLLDLGTMHWEHGRSRRARHCFAMSETRFREQGDFRGTGAALIALADVDAESGDGDGAMAELRQALELLRECDDVRGQSVASYQLGSLLHDLGDVRQAGESFEVSLLLAERCGSGRQYDQAGKRYADLLRRHGRLEEAELLLADALDGAVRSHERHWEAHVLRSFGDLRAELGDIKESRRYLTRSLELFTQLGHRHAAAYTHRSLAEAWVTTEPALAEWHLRTALRTFRDLRDRRGAGYALLTLGRIRTRSGDIDAAAESLDTAAGVFLELGFPLWELRALSQLTSVGADTYRSRDRSREALTKIKLGVLGR